MKPINLTFEEKKIAKTRVFEATADAALVGSDWKVTVRRIDDDGTLSGTAESMLCLPPKDGVTPPVLSGDRVIRVISWNGQRVVVTVGSAGAMDHNKLDGLEGGDPSVPSYWHITEEQYDELIEGGYITPVPVTCDQNVHPYEPDPAPDHPYSDDTAIQGEHHPAVNDCYTTVPN